MYGSKKRKKANWVKKREGRSLISLRELPLTNGGCQLMPTELALGTAKYKQSGTNYCKSIKT